MIKCEVIEQFKLKEFDKLKNLKRNSSANKYGKLYVKDTFECDEDMVKYLTGNNEQGKTVVKVIEVEPVKEAPKVEALTDNEEPIVEVKPKKKKTNKK